MNAVTLEQLRVEIDKIDDEIAPLLARRMDLALEVARAKKQSGGPVYRPEREREIVERLRLTPALAQVYAAIFEASRALQRGIVE